MSEIENNSNKVENQIDKQWHEYERYTEKLSNCIRQLAFSEAAVFWVFSKNGNNLTNIIVFGFASIVFCFISEGLQYYFGQKDCYILAKKSEKEFFKNKIIDVSKIKKSHDFNNKIKFFFYCKIFFIFIASMLLIFQFGIQILQSG